MVSLDADSADPSEFFWSRDLDRVVNRTYRRNSMAKQVLRLFLVTVLVLGIGGPILAQRDAGTTFETPFEFQLGPETYSPGKYRVTHRMGEPFVRVMNVDTNKTEIIRYTTRISKKCDGCTKGGGAVVFDKTETTRYLTEVYFGDFEGFLFPGAPEDHEHQQLTGTP
jgi:hypothetical protein